MIEEILDGRAAVSPAMIELLLNEKQYKILISMIAIPRHMVHKASRPKFIDPKKHIYGNAIDQLFSRSDTSRIRKDEKDFKEKEMDIHFNDVLQIAFKMEIKTANIIELLRLMRKEVSQKNLQDADK